MPSLRFQEDALPSLMRAPVKTEANSQRPQLAKGQIWKTKEFLVQIVELGKVLVQYKLLKELGQMRRVQMSTVESMEDYLQAHEARLLHAA